MDADGEVKQRSSSDKQPTANVILASGRLRVRLRDDMTQLYSQLTVPLKHNKTNHKTSKPQTGIHWMIDLSALSGSRITGNHTSHIIVERKEEKLF